MEIRRFGIGQRRQEGPAGTHGVESQSIHSDERGVVAELAFRPKAAMAPHSNPNLSYFVVFEGGGFVQVGDEQGRVAAGEAVVWPPNVVHSAWTELTPMRAIVVEFAPGTKPLLLADRPAGEVDRASDQESLRADGSLAPKPPNDPADHRSSEEEPW